MAQATKGRKAGFNHSEATRRKMSESRKRSPKVRAHLKRLHAQQKGKPASSKAIAGSLATRKLRTMGLTRGDSIELWERYRDMYLKELEEKNG